MNIKVIIKPGEDGHAVAHVPSLKGVGNKVKPGKKHFRNIREAIDLFRNRL